MSYELCDASHIIFVTPACAQVLSVDILTATKEDACFKVRAMLMFRCNSTHKHFCNRCTDELLRTSLNLPTIVSLPAQIPFALTAVRNDYLHAVVAYFDITFGAGHKPVFFSTSPKARCVFWCAF